MARDGVPNVGFIHTGIGVLFAGSASSVGGLSKRWDLGFALSNWALRMQVTGAATEASVQLLGSVASSSDANSALMAMTTAILTGGTCDQTVWITGKPATAIMAQVTTLGLSSGASVRVWITGTA